jgi:hypothetical protein
MLQPYELSLARLWSGLSTYPPTLHPLPDFMVFKPRIPDQRMIPETNFRRIKPPEFLPNATGKTEVSNCTITTTYRGGRKNLSKRAGGSIPFCKILADFFDLSRFSEVNRVKRNLRCSPEIIKNCGALRRVMPNGCGSDHKIHSTFFPDFQR